MREPSQPLADDGSDRPGHRTGGERRLADTYDLRVQVQAALKQSALLAERLQASQRTARENWRLFRDTWDRAEQIRARWLAARADPDWLRYSAYARLQAQLGSMPVIEQAKGIIMAQYGCSEDQAFNTLRRASQRENIKVRDLAASVVARAASPAPARRRT
jgi:hypothetical protein